MNDVTTDVQVVDEEAVQVFISYSHKDTKMVNELKTFLSPLVSYANVDVWYDRLIDVGEDWNNEIGKRLNRAELIIYCVTADFLASKACKDEVNRGYKRHEDGRAFVIPVVFKACGWADVEPFKSRQLLEFDGEGVFSDEKMKDARLKSVYDLTKEKKDIALQIRRTAFAEEWKRELTSIGTLSSVLAPHAPHVSLHDIFVYPDVHDISPTANLDTYINSEMILDDLEKFHGIIVSGESQSGKTSLLYQYTQTLFERGFLPVYLDGKHRHEGNWEKRITKALNEQYAGTAVVSANRANLIVPIVDDLHMARDVKEMMVCINKYKFSIMAVDDIYSLNIESGISHLKFRCLHIVPMSATKRNSIIEKWIKVLENNGVAVEDDNFKQLDSLMEQVDATLGKVLGSGIVTAYPFFVLLILAMARSMQPSSISNITSQGYCYQALITIALANTGVEGSKTEMYFNYMEVLAYYFRNQLEISDEDLLAFNEKYTDKYNLSVKEEVVIRTLSRAGLFSKHSTGYYSFAQPYLKYYFVAKYIAGHFNECKEEYYNMVKNVNLSSNAYIIVFVSHHLKSDEQLQMLKDMAETIYGEEIVPCFFDKQDMSEIDKNCGKVIQAIMPSLSQPPSETRQRILAVQDSAEKERAKSENENEPETEEIKVFVKAMRLADTIGQIVKSREGSMEKVQLKSLMNLVILLHAKLIRAFLNTFIDCPEDIIKWIADLLSTQVKNKSAEAIQERASFIFWNINYYSLLGITTKCARSIGSESLYKILVDICRDNDYPLYKLLMFYFDMWYNKRIDVEAAISFNDRKNIPLSAKWIFKRLIIRFCATHKLDYKARQQLSAGLKIPFAIPPHSLIKAL